MQITVDGSKEVTAVFTEESPSSLFYLDTNGVTVKCENANVRDTGMASVVMYTKLITSGITPANAETTCTSEITSMGYMFFNASSFNGDISSWCVTNITSEPSSFATGSALQNSFKLVRGTCPGS